MKIKRKYTSEEILDICLKDFETTFNSIKTFNDDIALIEKSKEALESLFELVEIKDDWVQNRIENYLVSEITVHTLTILNIFLRIFDEHDDAKSLFKKIKLVDNSLTRGRIKKLIIPIIRDEKKYLDILNYEKSSNVITYFTLIKTISENNILYYQDRYAELKVIYDSLKLKDLRDNILAHNGRNISILEIIHSDLIPLYRSDEFQDLLINTDNMVLELGEVTGCKTLNREILYHGYTYKEIHHIMLDIKKVKESLEIN
jgi:hypothetical protein